MPASKWIAATRAPFSPELPQAFNIQEVPTVIIDGKFVTSPTRAGSHAAMPGVINELVAKARTERPKS